MSSAQAPTPPATPKRKGPPMSEATKLKLKEFRANRIKNGLPPKRRAQKNKGIALSEDIVKRHRLQKKASAASPVPIISAQ